MVLNEQRIQELEKRLTEKIGLLKFVGLPNPVRKEAAELARLDLKELLKAEMLYYGYIKRAEVPLRKFNEYCGDL